MYKWLKEYFTAFGKDFPFSKVADLNEYEIIRIIQYCVKTNTEYSDETERKSRRRYWIRQKSESVQFRI